MTFNPTATLKLIYISPIEENEKIKKKRKLEKRGGGNSVTRAHVVFTLIVSYFIPFLYSHK
jgi:hypothetical protein